MGEGEREAEMRVDKRISVTKIAKRKWMMHHSDGVELLLAEKISHKINKCMLV